MVIPSFKHLTGFPTGETAVNEQNTRAYFNLWKRGEQPLNRLEEGYLLSLSKWNDIIFK